LEKGLNAFFQSIQSTDRSAAAPGGGKSTRKVVACFDIEQLDEDERRSAKMGANRAPKKSRLEEEIEEDQQLVASEISAQAATSAQAKDASDEKTKYDYFKLLSWNIDGLDKSSVEARALGVANKILKYNNLKKITKTTTKTL
jgi:hypothetical protein